MDNGIDTECKALCDAINKLPGISTVESCCGHGERTYKIWFHPEGLDFLPNLLYWFDACHCGFGGWKVITYTDCAFSPATFMIEGPKGERAYEESKKIAEYILEHIEGMEGEGEEECN